MATITVSLPEALKDWIDARIDAGDYRSASEYVCTLIRRDQKHKSGITALRQALIEGEESGDASPLDMQEIIRDAKANLSEQPSLAMRHSDFKIGGEFHSGGKVWRCTDIGTRTVIAICLNDHADDSSWYNGPPYAVVEWVFDEYDQDGCEPASPPDQGEV